MIADAPVNATASTKSTSSNSTSATVSRVEIDTVSLPVPPTTVAAAFNAAAVENTITSVPFPPRMESVPPPPTMLSLSSPPRRVSLDALPTIVSLPAFPRIESPPAFPVMELAALFPMMVLLEAFPIALMAFDPVSSTLLIVPAKIVIEEKPPEISTLEEEARTSRPASAPVRMLVVPVPRLTSKVSTPVLPMSSTVAVP